MVHLQGFQAAALLRVSRYHGYGVAGRAVDPLDLGAHLSTTAESFDWVVLIQLYTQLLSSSDSLKIVILLCTYV